MKKIKTTLFLVLFVAIAANIQAQSIVRKMQDESWKQYRHSLKFSVGASQFYGDLGGSSGIGSHGLKDFDFKAIRMNFGLGYNYRIAKRWNYSFNLCYSKLNADDQFTTNEARNGRDLSTRIDMFEFSNQIEFYITVASKRNKATGKRGFPFTTYIFVGFGGVYYNPLGKYYTGSDGNYEWVPLRPLTTEGQGLVPTRKADKGIALVIPYGVGIKIPLTEKLQLGLEWGVRWTSTDYMDDVSTTFFDPEKIRQSVAAKHGKEKGDQAYYFAQLPGAGKNGYTPGEQRGNPTSKDAYMMLNVSLYWAFGQKKYERSFGKSIYR